MIPDGNGETVRVFLLDFSKAFEIINHQILIKKDAITWH
jgi:hypothetical protein